MSEIVKSVFINYIACAVFGGILEYLTPEKMRKTLRVCVVSLMLLTSVAPVLKIDINLKEIYSPEEFRVQEQYNALMHTANIIEKNVYAQMKEILINYEVGEYEIYVSTQISEDENIVYLEEVKIEVDKVYENRIPDIKSAVPDEYRQILKIGVKNE